MAEAEQAEGQRQDDEPPAIGVERLQREDPPPAFAKGWRWPLIIFVVGIVVLVVLLALTLPSSVPPPPPPPPPPPV